MIEKYFIDLLPTYQIYIDEIIETTQMICLQIARLNSDRKYLGCVDIVFVFIFHGSSVATPDLDTDMVNCYTYAYANIVHMLK
jgi:hypothetical protein